MWRAALRGRRRSGGPVGRSRGSTGGPVKELKLLRPNSQHREARPPDETISSPPLLTVRLLTTPPLSAVTTLWNTAVPPLTTPPERILTEIPISFATEVRAPEPISKMAPLIERVVKLALPIASKVPPELMMLPLSDPPAETISTPPALTLSDSAGLRKERSR